jgi:hypothetical protein
LVLDPKNTPKPYFGRNYQKKRQIFWKKNKWGISIKVPEMDEYSQFLYMLKNRRFMYKGEINLIWIISCTERKKKFNSQMKAHLFFIYIIIYVHLVSSITSCLPEAGDQEGGAE